MRSFVAACVAVVGAVMVLACSATPDEGGAGGSSGAAASGGAGAVGGAGGAGGASASGGFGGGGTGGVGLAIDAALDGYEMCAEAVVHPTRIIPRVVFLIDGSGSMTMDYSDMLSRWHALREAMLDPTDGVVTRLQSVVDFGMVIYNDFYDAPACPTTIEVATAANNGPALTAAFPDAPPGFSTPTGVALDQLVRRLPTAAESAALGQGPSIVILATDGVPYECVNSVTLDPPAVDMPAVVAAATLGVTRGINTYVISLAEATGAYATHLDEVAVAGGTQMAFGPANRTELVSRLESIVSNAVSCTVALAGSVGDGLECMGEVTLNTAPLICNDNNGWRLVDPSHIELTGSACTTFQSSVTAELVATFPCGIYQPE